jgi:hypothetical protein
VGVIVGVDFDNTIASYDALMHRLAAEWGLVEPGLQRNKKLIRDTIRQLPDGEAKWRRLQTHCYGSGIIEAPAMDGVQRFFASCKARRIPLWIVSHKTQFSNFGEPVDLRAAALGWLERKGFIGSTDFGIGGECVFFGETREEKIARIKELGITHFVDDLEETFLERSFPAAVARILFDPERPPSVTQRWHSFPTWSEIERHLLQH